MTAPPHQGHGQGPRSGPRESLFDRIPWRIVIPAGMQLAQELREAVRDYARTGGPNAAPPPPHGGGAADLGPQVHDLHRRLDRLETHHAELGRLIERLASQEAEGNRALQRLEMRVAVLLGLSGVALVLSVVALVAALAK